MKSKTTADSQPQQEQCPSLDRKSSSGRVLDTKRIQKSWASHHNPSSIINTGYIPPSKGDNDDENECSISPHTVASFEHSNRKLRTYMRLEELCLENEILQAQATSSRQCREGDLKPGHCFLQGRIHTNLYDVHDNNADSIHGRSTNENVPIQSMSALAFANTLENQAIVASEYPNIFRRDFMCGSYTQLIRKITDPQNIKSSEIEASLLKSNKHTTRDHRLPDDQRHEAGNSFSNRLYAQPGSLPINARTLYIQQQGIEPFPVVPASAKQSAFAHSRFSIPVCISASASMSKPMKLDGDGVSPPKDIAFAGYIPAVALSRRSAIVDSDVSSDENPMTDGAYFSRMRGKQKYPSDHDEDDQGSGLGADKGSGDERQASDKKQDSERQEPDDEKQDTESQGDRGEELDGSGSGEDNDPDENEDQLDGDDDEDDDEGDDDEDENEDEDGSNDNNTDDRSPVQRVKEGFHNQFTTDSTRALPLSIQRSYSTPQIGSQYRFTSSSTMQPPVSSSLSQDIATVAYRLASTSSDSISRSLHARFRSQPQKQNNLSTPSDDSRKQFQDEFLANVSAAGLEVDASGCEVRRSSRRSSRQSMPSASSQPSQESAIEESKKRMDMNITVGGSKSSMQQLLESTARKRTCDELFQEQTTGRDSSVPHRSTTLPSFGEFLEMSSKPPPPLPNNVRPRASNNGSANQLMKFSLKYHQQSLSSNEILTHLGPRQQQPQSHQNIQGIPAMGHLYGKVRPTWPTSSRQPPTGRARVRAQAPGRVQPGRQLPPHGFDHITVQTDFGYGYVVSPGIVDHNPSSIRNTLGQSYAPGGIGNRQHHGQDQRQGQRQTYEQDRHYNCNNGCNGNHDHSHNWSHVHGSRLQGYDQRYRHGHVHSTSVDQHYDKRRVYGHNSYRSDHGYKHQQQFNYNGASPSIQAYNQARVYENNNSSNGQHYNRSHGYGSRGQGYDAQRQGYGHIGSLQGYDNSVNRSQILSQGNSHDTIQSQTQGQGQRQGQGQGQGQDQGQGQGRSSQRNIQTTSATSNRVHSADSISDPAPDLTIQGPSQDNTRDAQCAQVATTTNKRCSRRARLNGRCYQHQG